MSHTFWSLRELRAHEASDPGTSGTERARAADAERIGWLRGGRPREGDRPMPEFLPVRPEAKFGHYLMMIGGPGRAGCDRAWAARSATTRPRRHRPCTCGSTGRCGWTGPPVPAASPKTPWPSTADHARRRGHRRCPRRRRPDHRGRAPGQPPTPALPPSRPQDHRGTPESSQPGRRVGADTAAGADLFHKPVSALVGHGGAVAAGELPVPDYEGRSRS